MKQEEKSKRSRERILSYAFAEFAGRGYLRSSINTICSSGQISKGLLYHHYRDKDALYMACVDWCFQKLTEYLSVQLDTWAVTLDLYFDTRLHFFEENPLYYRLFWDVMANPQPHLKERISTCRSSFDKLNEFVFAEILKNELLMDHITIEDALLQLRIVQDGFNAYLSQYGQEPISMTEHAQLCKKIYRTMCYGLVSQ